MMLYESTNNFCVELARESRFSQDYEKNCIVDVQEMLLIITVTLFLILILTGIGALAYNIWKNSKVTKEINK